MRPLLPILATLLAAAVAGCAEDPFVDAPPAVTANLTPGSAFSVCYAPGTPREVTDALANQTCGEVELQARWQRDDRYSCRARAIHRAWYACVSDDASTPSQ